MTSAMRLVVHLGRLSRSLMRYGVATRKVTVVLAVAVGMALVALALGASTAAPFVLYPFA